MYIFLVYPRGWPENPCSLEPYPITAGGKSDATDILALGMALDSSSEVEKYEIYDARQPRLMITEKPFGFYFRKQVKE